MKLEQKLLYFPRSREIEISTEQKAVHENFCAIWANLMVSAPVERSLWLFGRSGRAQCTRPETQTRSSATERRKAFAAARCARTLHCCKSAFRALVQRWEFHVRPLRILRTPFSRANAVQTVSETSKAAFRYIFNDHNSINTFASRKTSLKNSTFVQNALS